MIIQLIITATLLAITMFVFIMPDRQRPVKAMVALCMVGGILVTWNPGLATGLANAIGVGRGADLILYIWVLVSMLLSLLFFASVYRMRRTITRLTRSLSLLEARVSHHTDQSTTGNP